MATARTDEAVGPPQPFQVVPAVRVGPEPGLELANRPRLVLATARIRHGQKMRELRLNGYPQTSDYLRILNEQLGLEMAAVHGLTWDAILRGARVGDIDVVTAIMSTEERSAYLSFTEPYLHLPVVIVARKDFPHIEDMRDLEGRSVAVVKGYIAQQWIERDHPGLELMLVDRMDEAMRVVASGDADATICLLAVVEFFERKLGITNLRVAALTPYAADISIGVRKDLTPLVPILNKTLARFTEQEKKLIKEKWVNLRVERQTDWKMVGLWAGVPFLVIALVAASIFHSNRKLSREIAEHERTERALHDSISVQRRTETELRRAKEDAEAASHAKSTFLANMSHELRTPLNGIFGYAQILGRDRSLNQQQHEGVEVIRRSGEHLLSLINDILDMAKVEAGRMELEKNEFSLRELIENLETVFKIRAQQRGLSFSCEFTDVPVGVCMDEKKLRQILTNLLGNAIKFTKQGNVSLRISQSGGKRLRFQVDDTGIGIAKESLGAIFEGFKQVGAQSDAIEGTGLGLPISARLVELMGGELQVQSELSKGSSFWFELEVEELPNYTPSVAQEAKQITGYQGDPRKVLVADDQEENRRVLVDMLIPLGFLVEEVEDGRAAVDKTLTWHPDLVFMDLRMPVMDGNDAMQEIKSKPGGSQVVLVAVTASAFEADRKESADAGADEFVAIPVRQDHLTRLLAERLQLTWEYAEPQSQAVGEADRVVVAPPASELAVFLDLATSGNMLGIENRAAELRADDQFIGFAEHVTELAKDFKIEELQHFIEELSGTES